MTRAHIPRQGEYVGGVGSWSYLGNWRLNQRWGPGILWHANGDRYEGVFGRGRVCHFD